MNGKVVGYVVVCGLLATAASLRANSIIEQGGNLTTDLSGVTIIPLPSAPGTETWLVSVDLSMYSVIGFPPALNEPAAEPGVVNLLNPSGIGFDFTWISDVPAALADDNSFPSGTTSQWTTTQGTPIQVAFQDLGDHSAVPDSGSSGKLLSAALVALGGLGVFHKQHRRKPFPAFSGA